MTEPTPDEDEVRDDDARFDVLIERSSLGAAGARQLRQRIPHAEAEFIGKLAGTLEVLGRPSTHTTDSDQPEQIGAESGDPTDTGTNYGRPWPVISFWDALDPTERDLLRSMAHVRTFGAGATLMHEGERADHVMVILGGRVEIRVNDNGEERIIALRGPGDLVGERSALQVSIRSATVIALEMVWALIFQTKDFAAFISAHPRVLEMMESQVHDRLTQMPTAAGPRRLPLLNGENCTIVLTDVVGFGSPERTDKDRLVIREALVEMTRKMLRGMPVWSEDRGDGLLTVIPPSVPTGKVMGQLLAELPAALERHNSTHGDPARFRLQVAVDVGPVVSDQHGPTGRAINTAFRMVQARVFKRALSSANASVGIIVSDFIYETVISQGHGGTLVNPALYARVQVNNKESRFPAWMQLVGDVPIPEPRPGLPRDDQARVALP